MGIGGDQSRHGGVRRGGDPALVAAVGSQAIRQVQSVARDRRQRGSNSSRGRLWKVELQKLADETGLIIEVCHYPPGTSKWNKIEHRLFCHITELGWQALGERGGGRRVDRPDDNRNGIGSACVAGRKHL